MTGKRGPDCHACVHPDRASIELGLANRVPLRVLAKRFGISVDSVHRHGKKHMTPELVAQLMTRGRITEIDLEKLRETESEGLLHHLVAVRGRLYRAMDEADAEGKNVDVAKITSVLLKNLELTAKLLGDLQTGAAKVNILVLPEYHGLRTAIMRALRPFPEARSAVASALQTYETPEIPAIEGEVKRVGHRA